MKGGGTSVAPIYAGVRTDIEKLLEKFLAKNTVRYHHFMACFREMKFSLIFEGRTTDNELREYEEKLLSIALSYCFPPYSYQTQVGAIYMTYALYCLQPCKHRMKIRLTLPMLSVLLDLLGALQRDNHLDCTYVLLKLFEDDAFIFCMYPDEHNPLTYHRFDCKDDIEKATQTLRSGKSAMDEILEDVLMQQLDTIHEQYVIIKAALLHGCGELPDPLSLVTTSVVEYVRSAVKDCENKLELRFGRNSKRRHDSAGDPSGLKAKRNVKELRAEIRERAYATISQQGRLQRKKRPTKDRNRQSE